MSQDLESKILERLVAIETKIEQISDWEKRLRTLEVSSGKQWAIYGMISAFSGVLGAVMAVFMKMILEVASKGYAQ